MKFNRTYLYMLIFSILLIACEDKDKEPILVDLFTKAPFVSLDVESAVIDVSNLENSFFGGKLYAPDDNVASHEILVSRFSDGISSDTVPFKTITEFPTDFQVKANELAQALGINVDDLRPGDRFDFVCNSIGKNGKNLPYSDIDADFLGGDGAAGDLNQFYLLSTFLSCPFELDETIGIYNITEDTFGTSVGDLTFEVVKGENNSEIIMINPFDHINPESGLQDYYITINVDPMTGIASIARQDAWHCDNFGCAFGQGRIQGAGFVFSCEGVINLNLTHTVNAGSFGEYKFVAVKE